MSERIPPHTRPTDAFAYRRPIDTQTEDPTAHSVFMVEGVEYRKIVTPTNLILELAKPDERPTEFGIMTQQVGYNAYVTTHACQTLGLGNVGTMHTNLASEQARRMDPQVFDPHDFLEAAYAHLARTNPTLHIAYYQEESSLLNPESVEVFENEVRARALVLGFDPEAKRMETQPLFHGLKPAGFSATILYGRRFLED